MKSIVEVAALAMPALQRLTHKIAAKRAKTCVIGLGYVGLPLMMELGRAGYDVIGIDHSAEKVGRLREGRSYISDVDEAFLSELVFSGRIAATTQNEVLSQCDTVSICVPTPLRKTRDPDMSFVVAVAEKLAAHLHPGMLIILESTTYPGTTEEVILPMMEQSGLKVGEDFFLCFSPERVDPGNLHFHTRNIPKVIGGVR